MAKPKGTKEGSHDNGKGPMPDACPHDGDGELCALHKVGCYGGHQLVSGCTPLNCVKACGRPKKSDGQPCRKWKARGYKYCWWHRRYDSRPRSVADRRLTKITSRADATSMFYGSVLGPKLKAVVEELTSRPAHEQLNVYEELQLIRSTGVQAVALYSAALETDNAQSVMTAALLMRDSLAFIIEQTAKVAAIEDRAKDKISVHTVSMIVQQMTRIMHRVCGEEHRDIAERFTELVSEEVRLPSVGDTTGTSLTPDMDVTEMDATVPGLPDVPPEEQDDEDSED